MDRVMLLGCFLLVIFGASFGVALNLANGMNAAVKSTLEISSFLATISASGVAIYALTSWRAEFKHTKKYDALAKLKAASDSLRVAPKYLRYSMMQSLTNDGLNPQRSEFVNDAFSSARKSWFFADAELGAAIDECEYFISEWDYRDLVCQQLTIYELVSDFKDEMMDLQFQFDEIDKSAVRQKHSAVEAECMRLLQVLHDSIRRMRDSSFRN